MEGMMGAAIKRRMESPAGAPATGGGMGAAMPPKPGMMPTSPGLGTEPANKVENAIAFLQGLMDAQDTAEEDKMKISRAIQALQGGTVPRPPGAPPGGIRRYEESGVGKSAADLTF